MTSATSTAIETPTYHTAYKTYSSTSTSSPMVSDFEDVKPHITMSGIPGMRGYLSSKKWGAGYIFYISNSHRPHLIHTFPFVKSKQKYIIE